MNETMFQEAMLDRVDAIDDVVLESEYEVVRSLLDIYIKDSMIQEAHKVDDEAPAEQPAAKKENIFKRAIRLIKTLIRKIIDKISMAYRKLRGKLKPGYKYTCECDLFATLALAQEIEGLLKSGAAMDGKVDVDKLKKKVTKALHKTTKISGADIEKLISDIRSTITRCRDLVDTSFDMNGEIDDLPDNFAAQIGAMNDCLNEIFMAVKSVETIKAEEDMEGHAA